MAISRRQFLGSSAAATAAVWSTSWTKSVFAQDTADIRVAVIGFNGQGSGHIEASHRNIVALCDVDERVLANKAKEMADKYGKKVDTYTDFRKLLERKDIDAVSIATPNHMHALIAVVAAQAGKHVYVEKPASHNIWEGRQMVAAARQNNRVMQVGTQSRSSQSLKEAVEWVQGGDARQNPVRGRHVLQAAAEHRQARQAARDSRARFTTTCGAARPRRKTSTGPSCTTIGTGIGTPATATWATRASTRWTSPAGSSASRRSRRG